MRWAPTGPNGRAGGPGCIRDRRRNGLRNGLCYGLCDGLLNEICKKNRKGQ